MACCAAAAYIVWKLMSTYDRLFHVAPSPELSFSDGKVPTGGGRRESILSPKYGSENSHQAAPSSPASRPGILGSTVGVCTLSLEGITCGACVQQIQSALNAHHAVKSSNISLALLRARVVYDFTSALPADLVSVIQDAGYDARETTSASAQLSVQDMIAAFVESDASWNRSLDQLRREFVSSLAISSFLFSIRYLSPWLGIRGTFVLYGFQVLAAVACLVVSRRIHFQAAQSLLRGGPRTVATLASSGMMMALFHSLVLLAVQLSQSVEPIYIIHAMRTNSLDGMGTLCAIILGGQLLKTASSRRSFGQAARLARLFPHHANVVTADTGPTPSEKPTPVAVDMLEPGDTIIVHDNDHIPVDGVVLSGTAYVDQSWMTGNGELASLSPGDRVFAGCSLSRGEFAVLVEDSGVATRLGRLLQRVSTSEIASGPTGVETRSGAFVDTILLLVFLTTVAWRIAGWPWSECLRIIVSMLVCACPCALELSVPITLISAAASAAKANIQLSARVDRVENAARTTTVLFDKTGTLTTGQLSVNWQLLTPDWDATEETRRQWWALVCAVEQHDAKHPLPLAIIRESEAQKRRSPDHWPQVSVKSVRNEPGRGVQGRVALDDRSAVHVAIGSRRFLSSLGVDPDFSPVPQVARSEVATTVCVAIDGKHAGILVCQDAVRPSARQLVRRLSRSGIRVGMITGDSWSAALLVARSVGIPSENVYAELLPLDKASVVKAEKCKGAVMVVGDNLNDMAAFSESSFSVYVDSGGSGTGGTDATLLPVADGLESSKIPMDDSEAEHGVPKNTIDLTQLQHIILRSRRAIRKIQQNNGLSLAYNLLALTLASGVLQRVNTHFVLSPMMASIGMGLNSALVLWNGRVDVS